MQNKFQNIKQNNKAVRKEVKDFEKSLWTFFLRKSRLTWLIIVFLLIFGSLMISKLPKELNPEVEIPIGMVTTIYPGASPKDVEKQITKAIEDQIIDLDGIKKINSTSSQGMSSIVVEFEVDQNVDDSIRRLDDEVSKIESELPDDATVPVVKEISFNDEPIAVITISANAYDLAELKTFAEELEDEIKNIAYVSDVKVVGGSDKIIDVDLNKDKLTQYGLSVDEIISVINSNNLNIPFGNLEIGDTYYGFRMQGEFQSAQDIGNLTIANIKGASILLSDVAEVKEKFEDVSSMSHFAYQGSEINDAVSIQVYKKNGGDIVKLVEEIKSIVASEKGNLYPKDVRVELTRDLSKMISERINNLLFNGLGTVIIILILLFLFLGSREAFIAGMAVPFSFFVAFIVMALLGESLNFLSLFSLVLALGLLVDSSIIIVEGIYEKIEKFGATGYEAAILTIKEHATPLMSGMLTTVAAFFPLMFVKGIFGQFMKGIPIVVNTTLIAALFISLSIIPVAGALLVGKKNSKNKLKEKCGWLKKICQRIGKLCLQKPQEERFFNKLFVALSEKYSKVITFALSAKKNRRILIGGIWIVFFLTLLLPISGVLKIQSFSKPDSDYFFINIKTPNGTNLEKTELVAKEVEQILIDENQVKNFVANIGSNLGSSGGSENVAFIEANLIDKKDRGEKSYEITSRLRKFFDNIPGAEISFVEESMGPPTGDPIEARVVGDDLLILEKIANDVKNELSGIETVIDTKTSIDLSSGEFVFIPNKDLIAQKGLSVAQVGREIRNSISGNNTMEISKNGDDLKIKIALDDRVKNSVEAVSDLEIKNYKGEYYSLDSLGEIQLSSALSQINHRDGERVIIVSAGTDGGNATQITNTLKEKIAKMNLPEGYSIQFGGEEQELQEIFMDMFLKMIIGVILVILILILQFNSYRQVALIFFTIPLSMIGVFIGMTLFRLTLDIPSFIGIVSLVGIVVNDAIILIHQINEQNRKGGDNEIEKVVQKAAVKRLRPIILTTVTTVFGLLPLSITQPEWRNLGFAIIFGLTFATVLTLFVIPAMYVSFYNRKVE